MASPSRHVELVPYANDTAVVATSCQPALLFKYLETYLSDLERWLREWRLSINVSNSSAMLFAKASKRVPKPRSVQLFGEPIQWCDTARYLGVTLDTWLTWLTRIDQAKNKAAQRLGVLGLLLILLNRRSDLSIRNGVILYKQLIRPMVDYGCPYGVPSLAPISGNGRCFIPSVFELPPLHLGTLVTSKFIMIWESISLPTTLYL